MTDFDNNNSRDDLNPLDLDEEEMRRLGYQAIDTLIAHFKSLGDKPVVPPRNRMTIPQELLAFSEQSKDMGGLLTESMNSVFKDSMQLNHPRFYAYIPGSNNYVSALADLLVSGVNVFAGTTPYNRGSHEVEQQTIRWLCSLADMDNKSGGLFVSGGSVAILTGLAAARQRILDNDIRDARVYCSDQTHSSVERALFLLGFENNQIREIDSDQDLRLDIGKLEQAIDKDKTEGLRPFCVVGNAGTTNTGAIDPLDGIAALCRKHSLWFHADAAYGGGAMLSPSVKPLFKGIGDADSISIDPHKWLFQPYENACVLVKDPTCLRETFRRLPDYMRDTDAGPEQPNFRDMSPQVTRAFKAYKLWLSLHAFGIGAFRRAVEKGLAMTGYMEDALCQRPNWEVVTPAKLGIVTFRYVFSTTDVTVQNRLNRELVEKANDDGFSFFSSTRLFGLDVNRACAINPGLTTTDIDQTLDRLEELAAALS